MTRRCSAEGATLVPVSLLLLAGVGLAQTPAISPVPPLPANSSAALAMFAPIGGFPRPGDPGQPPAECPLLRQSGVFGFTDSMGTPDPNDDREYFLACRSDGIHIIDATPQSGTPAGVQWSASASQVVIPASKQHRAFTYNKGDGAVADSATSDIDMPFVQPLGYSQYPDKVHHIRGLGRTGFLAQYNDGISLAFLTGQAGEEPPVLGSFDTAFTSLPLAGNQRQQILDGFLGAWDVYPGTDSGVIYVSGGTSLGLAFAIKQGHLNRYWGSTPFTAGPAQGLHPVVVNPYGPPRVGGSLILRDANAGKYPTMSNNQPVSYRWTLCYSFQQDPISPDVTWTPAFVGGTPTPAMGARNLTTVFTTSSNAIGNDLFVFPALVGAAGDKYFVQMVVEEYSGANPTGRWAASRGTWFGLAP